MPLFPPESSSTSLSALASNDLDLSDTLRHFTDNAIVEQNHHLSMDEDVRREINSVAMQKRLGDTDKDIEMDEDIVTCEDTELENVPVTADVFSTALSRKFTLSPSEVTPIDPPWKASPTTSPISEAGDQGYQDAQSGRHDGPSGAESSALNQDTSTQQNEPITSTDAALGSSELRFSPEEARKPEEEAVTQEPSKVAKEPKWEVNRILTSAILSDGLLYYRVSWKGWGKPDYGMYPAHNFRESPDGLLSFHRRNPKEPGPPMRLDFWKKAFDNDEELEKHKDDDLPGQKGKRIKERLPRKGKVVARRR